MSLGEYELDDGVCPHCGSENIKRDIPMSEWYCRDCAGSNYETPPNVTELIEQGLTPAEAVDWIAVVLKGITQTRWADKRGRDQSTISENVSKAGAKLRD